MNARILDLAQRFKDLRVLVIGEAMLDSYEFYYKATFGTKPNRIFVFQVNCSAINLSSD